MNTARASTQNTPDSTAPELQKDLVNDLTWLLEESNDYNMIINVGEAPIIKSYKVHTSMLKARSLYFRAVLSGGHHFSPNGGNSLIELTQANIVPDSFEVILKYLYTGEMSLEGEQNAKKLLEYIIAAEKLWLFQLIQHIESYLILVMSDWLKSNFVYFITKIRSNFSSFKLLHEFSDDILQNHPRLLFNSNDFHNLPGSILINLLQRRNFSKNVAEKEVLSVVLNWGIKQNDDLIVKNVNKWTPSDHNKLQTTLQYCIPLIRYTSIPPEVFFKIIGPYKQIFTPGHYERIMQIPTFVTYNKLMRPYVSPRASPVFPSTPLLASILKEFPMPPSSTPTPPISRSNSPINFPTPRFNQNRATFGLSPIITLSPPTKEKRQSSKSRHIVRRKTKSLLINRPQILLIKRANSLPTSSRKKPRPISIYSIETSKNSSSPIKARLIKRTSISPPITQLKAVKSIEPQVIETSPLVRSKKGLKRTTQDTPLKIVKSIEPLMVNTSPLVIRKNRISLVTPVSLEPNLLVEDQNKKVLRRVSPVTPVSFEPQIMDASSQIIHNIRRDLNQKALNRKFSIVSRSRTASPNLATPTPIMI